MTKTYGSHLERVIDALIQEEIESEKSVLESGNIQSYEEYKHRAGYIRGLRKAIEIMDDAEYFIRTGKRRGED